MELEQLIADVNSVDSKTGFKDRLKKVRDRIHVEGNVIKIESEGFSDFHDHTNHSDWENRTVKIKPTGKLLKLTSITLKGVSNICGHTDHSDHYDFNDQSSS